MGGLLALPLQEAWPLPPDERAAAALAPSWGQSQPAERGETLEVWWGGLKAAEIRWNDSRESGSYRTRFELRTVGTARWFTGFDLEAGGTGTIGADGLDPRSYDQRATWRKGERTLAVAFGEDGAARIVQDELRLVPGATPPPGPEPEPPTPAMLENVLDPASAILAVGRAVLAGETGFTVPVFDGQRRYDVAARVLGPGRHAIRDRDHDTLDVELTVQARAGFRPKALQLWDKAVFVAYLSPEDGLPLRVESTSFPIGTVATMIRRCPPAPKCELGPS